MLEYKLTDCWERSKQHPTTFEIPTREEIRELKMGDFVKLIFNDEERMWVEIMGKRLTTWIGRLDSQPLCAPLEKNTEIEFETRHICSIMKEK